MDTKVIAGMFVAAAMAILSWMANTTLELKLSVQRLEIIMQQDAITK